MINATEKSKRIAKNTVLLYCRTFITMLVGLFTSRIILNALGVENFGIYNVVGGTIAMFSIFTGSLSSSISRFITYGLGENDSLKVKTIFSTSLTIQICLGVLILLIAETIGFFMLNTELNIPENKLYDAYWVLQFSVLTFVLGMLSVPFNASIIAHEKMSVFAYMGVLEVVLKLIFVTAMYLYPGDRLILYASLLFLIALILQIIYMTYCYRHFEECKFKISINRSLIKEMTGFAWWGFFGNTAYIFNTQGVNIILNIYFGVVVNAARGVVGQVEGAVTQFVNNFMTALSPQITKSCAANDYEYMFKLICRGAKFAFFLLLFFLIPLEFEADIVLSLWLVNVPDYTALFLRWSLVCCAVMQLGGTSYTAIMAGGRIKNYSIVITIVGCLVFPLTWISFKLGLPAVSTYMIYTTIYMVLNLIRIYFLRILFRFPVRSYLTKVLIPVFKVIILSIIPVALVYVAMDSSFLRFITLTLVSTISISSSIYLLGLDVNEKKMITSKIMSKFFHKEGSLCQ